MNAPNNDKHLEVAAAEINELLARRRILKEFEEVLEFNPGLDSENRFIQMFMQGYVTDQCSRVRRLLDIHSLSLRRFLEGLEDKPEDEIKVMNEAGRKIKNYTDKWIAHKINDQEKYKAGYRDLNQIIDQLHRICLKYIRRLSDYREASEPLTLDLPFQENWRSIFYEPWIPDWKTFIKFTNGKERNLEDISRLSS